MTTNTSTTPTGSGGIDPQLAFQVLPAVGALPPFRLGDVPRKPDESAIQALAKAWKVEHARGRLAIEEAGDDTDELVDAIDARLESIEQAMASLEPCDGADVAAILDTAVALVDSMRGCTLDSDVTDDRLRPLLVAARRGAKDGSAFRRKPLAQVLLDIERNAAAEFEAWRKRHLDGSCPGAAPTDADCLRRSQARLSDLAKKLEAISDPAHLSAIIEGMTLAAEALHTPISSCTDGARLIEDRHVAATMLCDLQEFLDHVGYAAEERLDRLQAAEAKVSNSALEKLVARAVRREDWAEARRLIAAMEGAAPR